MILYSSKKIQKFVNLWKIYLKEKKIVHLFKEIGADRDKKNLHTLDNSKIIYENLIDVVIDFGHYFKKDDKLGNSKEIKIIKKYTKSLVFFN